MNKADFELTADDKHLDEEFENSINKIIAKTIYIVNGLKPNNYISLKDCQIIKDNGRIEVIISSITTQMYYDKTKQNYLFLASSLIKDLATKHVLYDSNKRTAFFTGKYILENKGQINFSMEKSKVLEFVKKIVMNHEKRVDLEKQLEYIQNVILKHSLKITALEEKKII